MGLENYVKYSRKGERITEVNGRKKDRSDGSTNNHVGRKKKRSELVRKKGNGETRLKEVTNRRRKGRNRNERIHNIGRIKEEEEDEEERRERKRVRMK